MLPANIPQLAKAGAEVLVEQGAGSAAGIPDQHYVDKGAQVVADRAELFAADVILQVRSYGANREAGGADLDRLTEGRC